MKILNMATHSIKIIDSGESFNCRQTDTLLVAMIGSGKTHIPVGCRSGGCGVCKIHIRSGEYVLGKMSRTQVSEAEESKGFALACRCTPLSDLSIEVVGRMRKGR
jgi:ferredoxin